MGYPMNIFRGVAVSALVVALGSGGAHAASIWISTESGQIGLVDTATGTIVGGKLFNTGQELTDIAFVGKQMYGTTFTGLLSINDTSGASTSVGSYTSGGSGMNALVGNGSSLLSASFNTHDVYTVSPSTAATSLFMAGKFASAGDLAAAGGTWYESVVDPTTGSNALYNVSTGALIGDFSAGGSSLSAVFGLADDGKTMYAVDGTSIYSVNLSNAQLTLLSNYSGTGLRAASGTAFISESGPTVPEPSTWALMGLGFGGVGLLGFRRRHGSAALA